MKPAVICKILLAALAVLGAETNVALRWSQLPSLPDPNGVAALFAGVSGGALLVAGGANFPDGKPWEGGKKVWHDAVFILERPDGTWKLAGRLPRPLAYGVSITHRDEVICAGGSDEKQHYTEVFALRWRDGKLTWRALPSLPRPIANACGATLNNVLYIAGGIATPDATNALGTFFAIDLNATSPKWRQLPPWPGPLRMLSLAAAQGGSFFVVGGVRLSGGPDGKAVRHYLRDGYRYDPAHGWKRISDLPLLIAAAPSPAPTVGSTHFFIISGDDGMNVLTPPGSHPGFTNHVLAYDVTRDLWARVGTTPAPRVTLPVVHWGERWIIPSGEQRPGVRSPEVFSLIVTE